MAESAALSVGPEAVRAIVDHAERERPRECCGVLLGEGAAVLDAVPVPNLAKSPSRFFLDPQGHIEARRDARRRGLEVVGFYHSHPHSAPVPSVTDLEEANDDDAIHVIVGQDGGRWSMRAFRLAGGQAREVKMR